MRLIDRLKQLEDSKIDYGETFQFKIDLIMKHVKKKLNKLLPLIHPTFTLHDYDHVKAVISNLDWFCDIMELFSDKNDRRLSKYEIFLLLAGACLHDIGMVLLKDKDKDMVRLISSQDTAPLSMADLSRLIRKDHHERSMIYVLQKYNDLNLTVTESRHIGKICYGHYDWEIEDKRYDDQPDHTNEQDRNAVVRIRLLTALLQVADELDTSCERAPEDIRKILQDLSMDSISRFHWMKHYYTGKPRFLKQDGDGDGDKKVIIELTLEVPDKLHGTRIKAVIEERIRKEINSVKPILSRYCGWLFHLNPITVKINTALEPTSEEVFRAYFLGDNQLEILVIEDDKEWRDIYQKTLGSGYSMCYAHDEESAVGKIKNGNYRLILLDLRLPDKDGYYSTDVGFSVLKKITEFSPDSIVMVITAWGTIDDSERMKDFKVIKYRGSKGKLSESLDTPRKIVGEKIKEYLHLLKKFD